MKITERLKANPQSTFEYYRENELYYRCGDLVFRVPVNDTGDGSFEPTIRSAHMLRWIRKELEAREGSE